MMDAAESMSDPEKKSRGLKYLTEVRPQAVEHLLKFFAESARHLDPRTRFLISIVTKVISHSSRGIRQYVKRALDEGATPDEIIDAVLCAYPCAGLTRVVDAVDVILDMDLPGFEPAALAAGLDQIERRANETGDTKADEGTWREVAALDKIPPVGGLCVELGSDQIALFKDEGKVFAVDDTCPHASTSLSGGLVTGGEVTCPRHRWRFRLDNGRCTNHPRATIRTYETRVDNGRVFVLAPKGQD